MSEDESLGNPIEQLNPNWETRFVIGYQTKPGGQGIQGETTPTEVNTPVYIIDQDRFTIPSVSHRELANFKGLQTRKGGFCVRVDDTLQMKPESPTTVQPVAQEDFEKALAVYGFEVIEPKDIKK